MTISPDSINKIEGSSRVRALLYHVDSFDNEDYPDTAGIVVGWTFKANIFEIANIGDNTITVTINGLSHRIKKNTAHTIQDSGGFDTVYITGYIGMNFSAKVAIC